MLCFVIRASTFLCHSSFVIRHFFCVNLSPENKIAGVLAPLFALRGENDLGIGDLGSLREFVDWAADIGFKLVQLLPINEMGADHSPYNAISAIASVRALIERAVSATAAGGAPDTLAEPLMQPLAMLAAAIRGPDSPAPQDPC